jgi:hypothetical protein
MYHVRIMNGSTARLYEGYTHVTETHFKDGFELELGGSGIVLRLPEDGDVIFVMDENGKTIATHRFTPKEVTSE